MVSIRPIKVAGVFTFIAAAILFFINPAFPARWEELFTVPWGTGEGECGQWSYSTGDDPSLREHPRCGPRSFAVDDRENIILLDTVNQRVNRYSIDGKHIVSFPASAHHTDLAVSPADGRLYLLSSCENLVRVYTPKGRLTSTAALPPDRGIFNRIYRDGMTIKTLSNRRQAREIGGDGSVKETSPSMRGSTQRKNYRIEPDEDPTRAILTVTDLAAKKAQSIPIKTSRALSRAQFLGASSRGVAVILDTFCTLEESHKLKQQSKEQRYVQVRLYNDDGKRISQVELPDYNYRFSLPESRAAVAGDYLYLMSYKEEGVKFCRINLNGEK